MLKGSGSGLRINERFSVRVHAPIKASRRWRGCQRRAGDTFGRCDRNVSEAVFAASEEELQSPKPMPPPPYGKLSVPVYSLATAGVFNGVSKSRATMNITTYATPIAIQPARRFVIALYHGTLSTENMLARGKAVLQILGEQHAELLPLLGKSSGHEIDKIALLEERGFETVERFGVPTLASCLGVVELSIVNIQDVGDHDVVLCDVERYEDFASESDLPLYTAKLRELGLVT